VRRYRRGYRPILVLLLLPLIFLVLGFEPGTQTSSDEARQVASSVPEVADLLSRPTVDSSADYDPASDSWQVVLTEEVSNTEVAELTVVDDTREVQGVEISPAAGTLTYPNTSEDDAIKLAAADPKVRDELAKHGPHTSYAEYKDGEWTAHFDVDEEEGIGGASADDGKKEVAQVGVNDETWQLDFAWTGDQVGWQMARGEYGSYGKQANYWYVWGPLALLFALAFWRTDKLYSLRNLDVIALLSFLISQGFFRQGIIQESVLLWYPPLIYLFFRTLLMGFGVGERVEKTSNFSTPVLFVLGALASGFLLVLNLDARVIDVGYAGVVGANLIVHGTLPYGNMTGDVGQGDTYGPLNYLLYVPFRLMFGWSGLWDYLPAAHAVTAFAFVAGALALLFAGWKYAGTRGGAALLFAWAVFPYTLYSTNNNTNDVIVAAIAAIGLAVAASPLARGASVAAGFAVKLFPLILAPLWMFHEGRRRTSDLLDFAIGGLGVVLLTFWVLALGGDPSGNLVLFIQRTLAFQGGRETPWTIFTQIPELGFLHLPLTVAMILLAFLLAVAPKKRTIRRLGALSAALVIGFELTLNYWFYTYVIWFEPFIFLALLLATNEKTALDAEEAEPAGDRIAPQKDPEPERSSSGFGHEPSSPPDR
jgi:hypothetical protein